MCRIGTPWFALIGLAAACTVGAVPSAARQVDLHFPIGIALDAQGRIWFSERGGHVVRRFDPESGDLMTISGTGKSGYSGDGGPAQQAQLSCPDAIDLDPAGNLYIADRCNERIRRVDAATGHIDTIAGNGETGPGPDGPARDVALTGVFYLRFQNQRLLFTDTNAHRIREFDPASGRIRTLAGSGAGGFSGDGGPAINAALARPHVALYARNGDLIIGDSFNARIRRVDQQTGIMRTIAGSGERAAGQPGPDALRSPLFFFGEIHERENGDLVWSEWASDQFLRLDAQTGALHRLHGGQNPPPAQGADANTVADFAFDAQDRIIAAAPMANQIRRINWTTGKVEVLVGR